MNRRFFYIASISLALLFGCAEDIGPKATTNDIKGDLANVFLDAPAKSFRLGQSLESSEQKIWNYISKIYFQFYKKTLREM